MKGNSKRTVAANKAEPRGRRRHRRADSPSLFIGNWATRLASELPASRRALDVAMGRGRHACMLAELGFRTFGVDVNVDAVRTATREARARDLVVRGWCADLTASALPRNFFELVVVTRYLQRDLFGGIRDAATLGGFILYETFTVNQRALGVGPRSSEHLLEPDELRARFQGFEIVFYEEVSTPEALARIVARKTSRS